MMAYCDLHTHSYFSDGTCSPAELLHLAQQLQLSAVAMCDHNTVSGLKEFVAAGENSPVEAVPGVEFSTQYGDTELHILGLFIRPEKYGEITELLETLLKAKEQSNRTLLERLRTAGIALDYDKIKSHAGEYVNRAVIGAEMTRLGYVASVQDAFKQYLSESKGFYVPPRRLDAYGAIRFIKSIGAVAVLAHPFLNLNEAGLRAFLPQAVETGLDGMEVYYSKYSPEQTALAQQIAAQFGLLPSGGSDYHGDNKPGIDLGVGRGDLRIPSSWLEDLRKRANLEG
ncbi:MAG: PHP domain-containing protein [Oscillospiraceae bacterium]|nr:PHP domain-containing protein [Oscillospiraceae bacterium]